MTSPPAIYRQVAVLDLVREGQRRLAESVAATGIGVCEISDLDDLARALKAAEASVAAIAYESLWPDPHRAARELRQQAPRARLIVAYSEGSARRRLGERLWSVGLFDYFIARSMPPHQLRPIVRQAYADALLENADDTGAASTDAESASMRFLNRISAAFTNQSRIDALLRELRTKLARYLDYHLLQVLVIDPVSGSGKLHQFQTRRLMHEVIWALAERVCTAVAPFIDEKLTPNDLNFVDSPPLTPTRAATPGAPAEPGSMDARHGIALPMVQCGELIGCIALLPRHPASVTAEQLKTLRLVSYQLATSLRNAQSLKVAEDASLIDELTRAHNRRHMNRALDIDHFKRLNDQHGHLVGDGVLRGLTDVLRQHLRDTDHLVRYGGEEFLVIMPETGPSEATMAFDRVRADLRRRPLHSDDNSGDVYITVSAGVAAVPACAARSVLDLLEIADRALLVAKRTGRNRICIGDERVDGAGGEIKDDPADLVEKRRFPRIPSQLKVRFLPLPGFEQRGLAMQTTNIAAEGLALRGAAFALRKDVYALTYIEDDPRPQLAQVVWTSAEARGERSAGLRFVRRAEIEAALQVPPTEELTRPPSTHPRALVVADNPRTRSMVHRVLRAAQYQTDLLDEGQPLPTQLADYEAIIVGESVFAGPLAHRLGDAQRTDGFCGRLVLVSEQGDRQRTLETLRSSRIHHLVSADEGSEAALFATLNKLVVGDYFGLKKYLLWGCSPSSWRVDSSADKRHVLEGIRAVAADVSCHPRITDLLVAAADEMIESALSQTRSPATSPDHDDPAAAQPAAVLVSPVTVEAGTDGRFLAVAVVDESGTFKPEDLYRSLGAALHHRDQGQSGDSQPASPGLHAMLTALSQLAINVDPGRRTEIVGIVDLRKPLPDYGDPGVPSLGLFYPPGADDPEGGCSPE